MPSVHQTQAEMEVMEVRAVRRVQMSGSAGLIMEQVLEEQEN